MFKKKQPPIRTLIGEGTRIEGRIAFADALRIDGEIVGDVVAAAVPEIEKRVTSQR